MTKWIGIVGLRMGADDYIVKPFSPREVVARVEALLRRARWRAEAEGCAGRVCRLNTETYVARWQGQVFRLNTR